MLHLCRHSPIGFNARLLIAALCVIIYLVRLNIVVTAWGSNTAISKLSNTLPSAEKLVMSAILTHACGLVYCLPFYYLAFDRDLAHVGVFSDPRDYCALLVYIVGTIFHFLGDYQKRVFKQNPENHGRLLTTGVWSLSRHPNYFGDFLIYTSFALFVYEHPLAWVSPVLNLLQYLFDAIPKNEQWAADKYGRQWQTYASTTAMFAPVPVFRKKVKL